MTNTPYVKIIICHTRSNLIACCYGNAIPDERVGGSFDFPTVHPTKLIYTRFRDYQSSRTHLIYPTSEVQTFKYAWPNGKIRGQSGFVVAQCLHYISDLKASVQTRYYALVINICLLKAAQLCERFFNGVLSYFARGVLGKKILKVTTVQKLCRPMLYREVNKVEI